LPERSSSRLLLLDGASASWEDRQMRELPALLAPTDLLIFNDTRVVPARLTARKLTGGRLELLLERPLTCDRALVQVRDSKSLRPGQEIETAGGRLTLLGRQGELWEIQLPATAVDFFEKHGAVPLPPYIRRQAQAADRDRYQSLMAREPGAVAAPTASLHFDRALLQALTARGVDSAALTLHVGAGTFQPVRTEEVEAHRLHAERYRVPAQVVEAVGRARAAGGRVIAVGTTVARALEAAAARGALGPSDGETALFIRPGYRFRVIDGLLTNFHLPQSTLLMLVAALAGRETVLAAYAHAVRQRYRFFSYGDAMLVWPASPRAGGPGGES
jgi:S-adenosylmethionine:tRNA ribosyltransferase-isomerase